MANYALSELFIALIEAFGGPRPTSFGPGELYEALVLAIQSSGGGGYKSLTGPGKSATPGDLTQAGGFTVTDSAGDGIFLNSTGGTIELLNTNSVIQMSGGIQMTSTGGTIELQGAALILEALTINAGITLQTAGSTGTDYPTTLFIADTLAHLETPGGIGTAWGLTSDGNLYFYPSDGPWRSLLSGPSSENSIRAAALQDQRRQGGSLTPNASEGLVHVATATNITNVSTTITVTTPLQVAIGELVTIANSAGFATNNPNGIWKVTTVSTTGFTAVVTSAPTGTYTANSAQVYVTRPVIDMILGDSTAFGEGAGPNGISGIGYTDNMTQLSTLENRNAGQPDPGRGFRRCNAPFFSSDTWTNLANNTVATATAASSPAGGPYTLTFASTTGMLVGDEVSGAGISGFPSPPTVVTSIAAGVVTLNGVIATGGLTTSNYTFTHIVTTSGPCATFGTSWALSASGQVIGDTQQFRRAVVMLKRRINGDGAQVSFNGGSSFTSTIDLNGSGYVMVDSGDLGASVPRTVQVQWESHVTGSGGFGSEVAGGRLYQTGGDTGAYNDVLAASGTTAGDWCANTDWDTYWLPMVRPRYNIIQVGINDLALGVALYSASNSGTTITATVGGVYTNGQQITITGATGGTWSNINGTWTITSVSGSGSLATIQFVVSVAPTGSLLTRTAFITQNLATLTANVSSLVARSQAASPTTTVVLVAQYHPGSSAYNTGITGANWGTFVTAYNTIAETYNCEFVDLFARFGDVSVRGGDSGDPYGITQTGGTLGTTGDGVHFGDASASSSGRDGQLALAETFREKLSYPHNLVGSPAVGWTLDPNVWTLSQAGTGTLGNGFSVPGNRTNLYQKGLYVRWSESGTVLYGVIAGSLFTAASNTTGVTMIPTTDFESSGTGHPDTGSVWYATARPPGFPTAFTWTPQLTGASGGSTATTWAVFGGQCTVSMVYISVGTQSAVTIDAVAPIQAFSYAQSVGVGIDQAAVVSVAAAIVGASSTITIGNPTNGTWHGSGNFAANYTLIYPI